MHIGILSFSILAVHALGAGFFTYLQRIKPQRYLKVWTIGWYLLVLHDLTLGPTYWLAISGRGPSNLLILFDRSFIATSGVAFFCAARLYINRRPWTPAAFLMGVWIGLSALSLHYESLRMGPQIGTITVYLAVAYVFWQAARRQESHGDWA